MLYRLIFAFTILGFLALSPCHAEFLKTGPLVYQSTDKRVKVIVSQVVPGIFIASGNEIGLQEFEPGMLTENGWRHVFIHFDPKSGRYDSLFHGKREYRIGGSLTLILGQLRVGLDSSSPYLSIVIEGDRQKKQSGSILSFQGLSEVVNTTGEDALALLEANQLGEYRHIIKPYSVEERAITLDGRPFTGGSLGLEIAVKNPCLERESVVLEQTAYEKVNEIADPKAQKEYMANLVLQSKKANPLLGLLKLSLSKETVLIYDFKRAELKTLKEVKGLAPKVTVCMIEKFHGK